MFSKVLPTVMKFSSSLANSLIIGMGRGVVVQMICGLSPNRQPNTKLSHVSLGYLNLASSSTQALPCCGPRN